MSAMIRHICVVACLLFAVASRPVGACSCGGFETPCDAYWSADVVFAGRAAAVSIGAGVGSPGGVRRAHFEVTERFRGTDAESLLVLTDGSETACGFQFEAGQWYVVHAHRRADGTLWTSRCSGTERVEASASGAGLAYARSARAIGPETRVRLTGRVYAVDRPAAPQRALVPGVVIASGDRGTFSAPSDASGAFVLAGLPRGTYRVFAELPGFDPIRNSLRLDDPEGCHPLVVPVYYGSRLYGRVVTRTGEPVPGVPLHLVFPDEVQRPSDFRTQGWTEPDGTFELRAVPPGDYLLGLNSTVAPSGVASMPPAFHPGVRDAAGADVVSIGVNERKDAGDFVLPAGVSLTAVRGIVVGEMGQPLAAARVTVPGFFGEIITDAGGAFLLSLVPGTQYRVYARTIVDADGRPEGARSGYATVDVASDTRVSERPPIVIRIASAPPWPPLGAGGAFAVPAKITDVAPEYPLSARQERVSGTVIVEATIGADGRVRQARVLQSVSPLDQPALDAVGQWEFTPALLNGVPVPVLMTVTVHFALQ